jgi:hypothetical protein
MPMDWDSDGKTELLIPSHVRVPWCFTWRRPSTEPPEEYCSTPNYPKPFSGGGAHNSYDHTIYQWDAIELVEDGQGGLSIQRRPTPIEALVRVSQEDDHLAMDSQTCSFGSSGSLA